MSRLDKMLAATSHGAGGLRGGRGEHGLRYLDYNVSMEESSLMEMLGPRLHPPQRLGLGLRALPREADLGEAEGPRGHTCRGDRRGCALAA